MDVTVVEVVFVVALSAETYVAQLVEPDLEGVPAGHQHPLPDVELPYPVTFRCLMSSGRSTYF